MTGQDIFLAMVVAAFSTFAITLGAVTIWTKIGERTGKA